MRDDPCRVYTPTLAALDEFEETGFDAASADAARAHLAGCSRCQARRRMDRDLDEALRDLLRDDAATPMITTADLLAVIGADHEPSERRTPMLSVVYLRNEDGIMDDDTQPQMGADAPPPPASSAPARAFAPLPSLRPAHSQPTWHRALTSLIAVAAVIALLGSITGALALTGRLRGVQTASHARTASATATAQGQPQPQVGPQYQIIGLVMDSATDGWAVMQNESFSGTGAPPAIILHIANGAITQQATLPTAGMFDATLRAFSPADVWLYFPHAQNALYHYEGQAWNPVTLPVPAGVPVGALSLEAVDFASASSGWAIGSYMPQNQVANQPTNLVQVFYRYDGRAWTIDQTDTAASVGGIVNPGTISAIGIQITGLSGLAGGDAFATGYVQTQNDNGYPTSTTGYIYHRSGGVWRLEQTLKDDQLTGIVMTGPYSGWIMGTYVKVNMVGGVIAPYQVTVQTPIALRWNGARWSQAAIPQPDQTQAGVNLSQIAAASPSNVWIIGASNGMTIASGQYAGDGTYLIHYDGSRWSPVSPPQVASFNPTNDPTSLSQVTFSHIALAPGGDLYIMGTVSANAPGVPYQGQPLLYRYSGGQWANISIPVPAK